MAGRDLESRVAELEAQAREAARRFASQWDRPAKIAVPPGLVLVQLVDESGNYPAPDATGAVVYPFRHCDATFTEARGTQAITWLPRSAAPHGFVCQFNGGYLWEDSYVWAWRQYERWWTAAPSVWLPGTLDGDLTEPGTATMSVYNPATFVDTTWNLTVKASWLSPGGTVSAGKRVRARWDEQDVQWIAELWEC